MENGADHERINKELGKIGSKTPGTITIDMVEEKETKRKNEPKNL